MGIDTYASVVVGLHRSVMESLLEEDLYELCDEHDMESFDPYYDGSEAAIVGFCYRASNRYSSTLFEWDNDAIEKLKMQFRTITGLQPNVYLTPDIS